MGDYVLAATEQERSRFRLMAANARRAEAELWAAAGIVEGARVADVGCGPGAMLAALARVVCPIGRVDGVDADEMAILHALDEVSSLPQAHASVGSVLDSGLEAGSYDAVVCRHVLAHNQVVEQEIVDHLATLAKVGGTVYLADFHVPGMAMHPSSPDLDELAARYLELHIRRGNDLQAGMRLGALLTAAGMVVERFTAGGPVFQVPAGVRPPSWAARDQLLAEGLCTTDDIARWADAFAELDARPERPWYSGSTCVALARRIA